MQLLDSQAFGAFVSCANAVPVVPVGINRVRAVLAAVNNTFRQLDLSNWRTTSSHIQRSGCE